MTFHQCTLRITVGVKRVSREVVEKIIAGRKEKKRKPLESIVEFLRASPPKVTSDVTMTPQPTTHVTKTRSKSTSSMHPSPITSPTRKMLHSPRLYIPQVNVNEVAEPRPAHSSKHLLSRKRSLENINTHQNGLDGMFLDDELSAFELTRFLYAAVRMPITLKLGNKTQIPAANF